MDRYSRQKINKARAFLNDTTEQLDSIFSGHYIKKKIEYIFFSSAHGTFSRIDHILRHKNKLNKFGYRNYFKHLL